MADFDHIPTKGDRARRLNWIEEVCQELIEWLLSMPREKALNAFQPGPRRKLAIHIEDALEEEEVFGYEKGLKRGLKGSQG